MWHKPPQVLEISSPLPLSLPPRLDPDGTVLPARAPSTVSSILKQAGRDSSNDVPASSMLREPRRWWRRALAQGGSITTARRDRSSRASRSCALLCVSFAAYQGLRVPRPHRREEIKQWTSRGGSSLSSGSCDQATSPSFPPALEASKRVLIGV